MPAIDGLPMPEPLRQVKPRAHGPDPVQDPVGSRPGGRPAGAPAADGAATAAPAATTPSRIARSAGRAQASVAEERQYRGHPPVDQLLAGQVELGENRVDMLLDR